MQLLVCASTEFEISSTIDFVREQNRNTIDVLITGVGMMATTYSLTKAILAKRPGFIFQAGVGGCLNEALPLTKIVLVENENVGDLGVEENKTFNTLFDLKLLDKNAPPWKEGKLRNNVEALKAAGLTIVDGVTVNEISTDKDRISYYKNHLNASVESMEGAALHYIALQEKISFLQMRALSNFAGERDKSKWVMDMAIARLNDELQRLLTKFMNR
jgi:futalosine hydrolase